MCEGVVGYGRRQTHGLRQMMMVKRKEGRKGRRDVKGYLKEGSHSRKVCRGVRDQLRQADRQVGCRAECQMIQVSSLMCKWSGRQADRETDGCARVQVRQAGRLVGVQAGRRAGRRARGRDQSSCTT